MKQSNILKSFESGWIVGLSDGNRVIVESPSGDLIEPYEGPSHQLFGLVRGDETIKIGDVQVCEKVRTLWARKAAAYNAALAAGDVDPVDGDTSEQEGREFGADYETDVPTLSELGFDGDSIRQEEV